ncbi:DcrB-related protein, partial [Bacillus licheniformis]|nr:DcrB-related protein [Bacillus licheniformis]
MYQMQEGTLALPVEWQDKTMNVFVSAATGTEGVSFVITRERLPWGMKFAEYVSSEIRKVAKQVPDYA